MSKRLCSVLFAVVALAVVSGFAQEKAAGADTESAVPEL
jgi:hypothetical protein